MAFIRKQNRLAKYDYSLPNYYFVTMCTQSRFEYFGKIINSAMVLNGCGKAAKKFWTEITQHYTNIKLDEFVVMPNHLHAIVVIQPFMAATGRRYSLSDIISAYKNIAGREIRKIDLNFNWQKSFYDHVVRKEESLDKIRQYIRNNPLQWEMDRNNSANLWM